MNEKSFQQPESRSERTPQRSDAATGSNAPRGERNGVRSLLPFIALGVILFLCLCGVGAYALLNVTGIITTQVNLLRTATPTFGALATSTPAATESGTPAAPSVTATNPNSATPTLAAATVELPETFTAFDADFFAETCPLFEGENETRAYGCAFGEYVMRHKQATTRYAFYDAEYDNAVVDATGYFVDGSGKYEYGVVVRGNQEGTAYYVFTVTNDGKYNVSLYQDKKYTDVVPYTESNFVNSGTQANTFRVIMFGKQLTFLLNGHFIASAPDNVLQDGVVGLFFYNAEPDAAVGFNQLTISTFAPPTPTVSADASATPTFELFFPTTTAAPTAAATSAAIKPGVYVNSLRLNPRAPQRGQPVTFFATFVNATGKPQSYKWFVEIWEANSAKKNPYGQADGLAQQIPNGANELATGASWKVAGGGPCLPFRARVVYQDSQARRIPFKRMNGGDLWLNFQVCP